MHNLDLFIEKVHNCAYDPALVHRESPTIFFTYLILRQTWDFASQM
jgi:hypothetical protein